MYNTFYGLNEDAYLEKDELDDEKQDYYDGLLTYMRGKSGYGFLDNL